MAVCVEMFNNLAVYVVETSFKIQMNLTVSLIEHHTLTTEVELELQFAILLISAQHEVFCEFCAIVALHPEKRVPCHH